MAKLLWSEYALKEAVKTIKAECLLHPDCKNCPLEDKNNDECMFDNKNPCDIDTDKIYDDKEY
jgi:hypothetical protein